MSYFLLNIFIYLYVNVINIKNSKKTLNIEKYRHFQVGAVIGAQTYCHHCWHFMNEYCILG